MKILASITEELLDILLTTKALKFGSFTLKDGSNSEYYLDLRVIPSYPSAFKKTIAMLTNALYDLKIGAIAGIMSAGIPYATGIALELELPLLQIRKKSKDYGLSKLIEGEWEKGWRIVVIDDVITTGSSKEPAIEALRELGLIPFRIQVLIDRTEKKSAPLVRGVPVHALARIQDLFSYGLEHDKFNQSIIPLVKQALERMES